MSDDALIAELRRDEGCVPHVYPDHLGFATIGVGRLVDERRGGGLSDDEIDYLLRNDVAKVKRQLDEHLPWWRELDAIRQRVLCNMAFQLGINGLLGFRNTLAAVKAHDWERAALGMMSSKWATQTPARAQRLAKMMRTGAA